MGRNSRKDAVVSTPFFPMTFVDSPATQCLSDSLHFHAWRRSPKAELRPSHRLTARPERAPNSPWLCLLPLWAERPLDSRLPNK